jgi:hypothetical protein
MQKKRFESDAVLENARLRVTENPERGCLTHDISPFADSTYCGRVRKTADVSDESPVLHSVTNDSVLDVYTGDFDKS